MLIVCTVSYGLAMSLGTIAIPHIAQVPGSLRKAGTTGAKASPTSCYSTLAREVGRTVSRHGRPNS